MAGSVAAAGPPALQVRYALCRAEISSPLFAALAVKDEAAKFAEAAKSANMVALSRRIFCDHLTPVTAYRCLVKEDDIDAPSFLFESVNQGPQGPNMGRYSIVGAQPAMEIVAKENMVTVMDHEEGQKKEEFVDDPTVVPRRIMERWNPQSIDDLPDVFCGGWVGYFSYDTVRYVERKKLSFSNAPKMIEIFQMSTWLDRLVHSDRKPSDDRALNKKLIFLTFGFHSLQRMESKAYVIHWVRVDRYASVELAYRDGKNRLSFLMSKIQNIDLPKLSAGFVDIRSREFRRSLTKATMSREMYKKAVLQAKEHILAGDIFQIVLTQRFERRTFAHPFEVYRSVRIVNPSPYMAYLQARGCILVASSPEMLIRVKKVKNNITPIGTQKFRFMVNQFAVSKLPLIQMRTEEEDIALEQELVKDEKQCAEHIMIVDLGRNDVGKVSKFGSVRVENLMNVDRYSHVMHMSSTVSGELQEHATCWDALRAVMPVGTVTGTPKSDGVDRRARGDAAGPVQRGVRGVSFGGDMELALALRTIVFPTAPGIVSDGRPRRRREWVAHLQAGAGIVADSQPDEEQRECESKAAAPSLAIDLAESAFLC
ncbi:unnamed protein product [Spirodela intermedia]|uniref:Uncharacterized protein n=1 Tax=Spirodela intermedia TaxID=51605 RepID=A0A7I8JHP7_SPIIN|nr:unnamed protein product [Spirodela intermedia]CAA6669441.1 unnamed protein product [Spirodela intermedia]